MIRYAEHSTPDKDKAEKCPYCGEEIYCDWVDVGVALQQCGPYHCHSCGASQISPFEKNVEEITTEEEREKGFFKDKISPLANTFQGKLVDHDMAMRLYKIGALDQK